MASDTLAKIDMARVVVAELTYGKREWKGLHEPASDVVIMEALRCAELEIARLTRELDAARERERGYREALERVVDGGCERVYAGDCWTAGHDPDAEEYADRVCDPCFAHRALTARRGEGGG